MVSKNRASDGKNIWNARDSKGVYFIQEAIRKAKQLNGKSFDYQIYPWKNPGETKARDKIFTFLLYPNVPPDNNGSERAIRNLKVKLKVSQQFKSSQGAKDYGILTLKMQYYFKPRYEFTVKPNVFVPPPKVDSAVISLIPRLDKPFVKDEKRFWRVVEVSLRNRRKILRRNLRELIGKEKVEILSEKCDIDLTRRGETLTETEFIKLYEAIEY